MARLTRRITAQGVCDAAQIDNHGLYSVALSFNLGLDAFHLVAVERVGDIATDVDGSHGCRVSMSFQRKNLLRANLILLRMGINSMNQVSYKLFLNRDNP